MSCRPSAHQHIHFSQAVRSNPVLQHNGNACSNKKGSFTPCFHSKLLFDCCNNVVNSSKTLTTCSNSPMSQLTAAGTLIKQCEPALLETIAWKYYYINSSQGKLVFILSCAVRQYIFTLRAWIRHRKPPRDATFIENVVAFLCRWWSSNNQGQFEPLSANSSCSLNVIDEKTKLSTLAAAV